MKTIVAIGWFVIAGVCGVAGLLGVRGVVVPGMTALVLANLYLLQVKRS